MSTETKQCPQCGEEILAIAKKCKHCQSDLVILSGGDATTAAVTASHSGGVDLGAVLLIVPVVGTLLVWFWIANMNLLQSPGNSLSLLVVATICITALLAAVEASKVGATADRKKGTYSPIQWFFITALLWIVGYPAYLFKRKAYGLKNYLWAGLAVMVVFLGSVTIIQSAIDDKINEVRKDLGMASNETESVFSQFIGLFFKSPAQKAKEAADIEKKIVGLLNQNDPLQTAVSEYFAETGEWAQSCEQIRVSCSQGVSIVGGRVVFKLSAIGDASVKGKTIILTPAVNANNDINWVCSSDADYPFIPSACQNALAALPPPTPAAVQPKTPAAPLPTAAVVPSADPKQAVPTAAQQVAQEEATPPINDSALPVTPVAAPTIAAAPSNEVAPTAGGSGKGIPSFDCAKAATVVEKLICTNPDLADQDAELAAYYKKVIAASGANSTIVRQGQRAFIVLRNQCTTVGCLSEAFRGRREELAQLGYVRE